MARNISLFYCLIICFGINAQPGIKKGADNKQKGFNKDNLRYGGNFGLSFGTMSFIEITPTISYLFTPKMCAGIGLNYIYYSITYNSGFDRYQTSIYGMNLFERYYFVENIFQHAELEFLNYEVPSFNNATGQIDVSRKTVPAFYIGAGYQSGPSGRGPYIMFLYDLLYDINSRNQNPYVFSIGFNF